MTEPAAGKNQEHDPHQEQDAPCRTQLFQNGPEKFERRMEYAVGLGFLSPPGAVVALVEPETGARVGVELGPELVEFEPLGHALPELVELTFYARGRRLCGS
jgi:hypothetical protein